MQQKGNGYLKPSIGDVVKDGILLEVASKEEAKIGEEQGAKALIVPFPHANNSHPTENKSKNFGQHLQVVQEIKEATSIPVIACCRHGHFVEAQLLEALRIDAIDEQDACQSLDAGSNHDVSGLYPINKRKFSTPFLCGANNLGEALNLIQEGALLLRTASTSNKAAYQSPLHCALATLRRVRSGIEQAAHANQDELDVLARVQKAPAQLLQRVAAQKRLPIPLIAQGGIVELTDCAMMMQLGAHAVIIDAKIWQQANAVDSIQRLVQGLQHYRDPEQLLRIFLQNSRLSGKREYQNVDYSMPFLSEAKKMGTRSENSMEYEIT